MSYDPDKHHRRSIRLKGYDYSQDGVYFVTICTHQHQCLFGHISNDGEMFFNEYGKIAHEEWGRTTTVRPYVILDAFMVMPNHIHGIIVISQPYQSPQEKRTQLPPNRMQHEKGRSTLPPLQQTGKKSPGGVTPNNVKPGSLGAIVRGYKSAVTRRINLLRNTPGATVWQGRYYDVIIRNETMYNKRRFYIHTNPTRWAFDENNPHNRK